MQTLTPTEIAYLMVACQQVVMALGWLAGAAIVVGSRGAMLHWALHAALSAAAVAWFVASVEPGHELMRALGNVSLVASIIALQRGVWHFFGRARPWRWHVVGMLAVIAAAIYGLDPAHRAWRAGIIFGVLAGLCVTTARDLQVQAQRRLELRWGALLAIPMLLAAALFVVRGALALMDPRGAVPMTTAFRAFGPESAVLYQIVALGFQLTLLALVVAHFVNELQNASRHDPLTGLLNRRAFNEALEAEVQRSRRTSEPFSVLMLDADHFKDINDRDGHAAGDRALQHLSTLLAAHMRDVDRVGRYGGEEFVVLLPGTSKPEALVTAQRLREKVQALPPRWQGRTLTLTISIGVSQWMGEGDEVGELLARADAALYRAKEAGRNRVAVAA